VVKPEGIVFFQAGGMALAVFPRNECESARAGRHSQVVRPVPAGVLRGLNWYRNAGRNTDGRLCRDGYRNTYRCGRQSNAQRAGDSDRAVALGGQGRAACIEIRKL